MLELKKKKLEKMKVECAKEEMLMKIYESELNIKRLNDNIVVQESRMKEIDLEIKELTKEG